MSQTTVNLGHVPVNRGEYSSSATYYKDNIVQYNGSSYICNVTEEDISHPTGISGITPYDSDPASPNTGWAVFANDSSGAGEGVYNVSVDHTTDNQPKIYASLSAALNDIPAAKKKGGMEIRFIFNNSNYAVDKEEGITTQPAGTLITSSPTMVDGTYKASQLLTYFSTLPTATGAGNAVVYYKEVDGTYTTWTITLQSSDNKYVQFRCMANAFTTDITQWQGVDEEVTKNSENLVESKAIYPTKSFVDNFTNSAFSTKINTFFAKAYIEIDGTVKAINYWLNQCVTGFIKADFLRIQAKLEGDRILLAGYSEPNDNSFMSALYPTPSGEASTGASVYTVDDYYSISGCKYYKVGFNSAESTALNIVAYEYKNEFEDSEVPDEILYFKNKTNISQSDGSVVSNNYTEQYTSDFICADKLYIEGLQDYNLVFVAGYDSPSDDSFIGSILGYYTKDAYAIQDNCIVSINEAKYYKIGFNSNYEQCKVVALKNKEEKEYKDNTVKIDTDNFEHYAYLATNGKRYSDIQWDNQYCSDFIEADEVYLKFGNDTDRIFLAGYKDKDYTTLIDYRISATTSIEGWFKIDGAKYYRIGYSAEYTVGDPVVIVKRKLTDNNQEKDDKQITYDCSNIVPYFSVDEDFGTKVGRSLAPTQSMDYANRAVESPCVWYEPSIKKFVMIHTSYGTSDNNGHICYAYSDDGISFVEQGIFWTGDSEDFNFTGPVMVIENGKYYLFYLAATESGYEAGEIMMKLSIGNSMSDFINGTSSASKIIFAPNSEKVWWARQKIYHPSFMKFGNKWYMFINCHGSDSNERVGYAICETLDGNWELQPNPLKETDEIVNHINSLHPELVPIIYMGDPAIFELDGFMIMVFFSFLNDNSGKTSGSACDYWAYTTKEQFPNGWKYGGVSVSPSESYDAIFAHKPYILKVRDYLYHYYTSVGQGGRGIALIKNPLY